MGLNFGRNSIKKSGENYETMKVSEFDPNPIKFIIKRYKEINGNTAIFINYPNCKNYEGNKIIVFKNTKWDQIKYLKEIDPHFTEENTIKAFARFEPTKEGWDTALFLTRFI